MPKDHIDHLFEEAEDLAKKVHELEKRVRGTTPIKPGDSEALNDLVAALAEARAEIASAILRGGSDSSE